MQRSSSGSRRPTGSSSHRAEANRVIENRIFINNTAGQPNLSQKLDDIKKQISRQYQKTFSTERKQSMVLRENEPSVLNSRKVKQVLAREEQQRYRQQYFQLKDHYLNEKKEFVQAIERYNSLRSVIESYFRNPLQGSYISKLKEYYLSDNIDEYIEFVIELNRENEQLKGHIERMLKIFQLHDFEDMIREITELLDRDRQQKARDFECELDRYKLELLEAQKQARDFSKVVDEQHEQMKELSVDLEAKRVLLKQTEKKLSEEHKQRIECQGDLLRTMGDRDTSMRHVEQLKKEFIAYTDRIKELSGTNDKLKDSVRKLQSIVEAQEKDNVELNRKVEIHDSQRARLLQSIVEGEERFQHLDNRLNKMIADYESSRLEWAEGLRVKDKEQTQLREQLTYEKISINRVCDLLRVVEQDEISQRIKSLLNTEVQHTASQPLLTDFHKKMEKMLNDSLQLKEELAKTSSERNEYKFVLSTLNQDIVRLRKQEEEKFRTATEKQEQSFRDQERQLCKQIDTLQAEKKNVEEQFTFHKKQNQVLLARNDKLLKDISAGEQTNRTLSADNKKLKSELSNIYVELKEIQELNGLTSNKLKISQQQNVSVKERLERTEAEMGKLVKQYQQELQRRDADIAIWREKCELALSNLETLKSEMAFRENDHKISIGKLTSDLESKCSLLSLTEEAHRRRLSQADKRYQQLSSQQSMLKDELATLQRQLLLKQEQLLQIGRKLREEKANAQKDQQRHKQKIEELQFDMSRRQLQHEQVNSELKKLRRDKNEMSVKLLKSKSDQKQQLQYLQEEKDRLEHDLEMALIREEQLANRRELEASAHKLQLQTETERKREVEESLRKTEKLLAETQQILANWNAEHDQTVIELAESQAYINQLQETLRKKEGDNQQLSSRIIELETDMENRQERKPRGQSGEWDQYIAPETPMRKGGAKESHEQKSPGMSSQEAQQLLLAMRNKEQAAQQLKEELAAREQRLNELRAQLSQSQHSLAATKDTLSRSQQAVAGLQQTIQQLRRELKQKSTELASFQSQLNNAKQQLHSENQATSKLRNLLATAEKRIQELTLLVEKQRAEKTSETHSPAKPQPDISKNYEELQHKYEQATNKLSVLESVYKQQLEHSRKQQLQVIRKLEEELNEANSQNDHLKDELAQTQNMLDDLNKNFDQLKDNESKRVKAVLLGLLNPEADKETREGYPYWPQLSDTFDEVMVKMNRLRQNALEISVVEAPRTNRNLPSPSPSIAKEFVFQRQKTDPVMEQPHIERIAQLTQQLEQLRQQNNQLKAQASEQAERNQQTFMRLQEQLKLQVRQAHRKIRELESTSNSQTVRTLKALFSKLLEALFANNAADLEEATRVILKILDFSSQEREDIQDNFEKRKKKKGFLGLFK